MNIHRASTNRIRTGHGHADSSEAPIDSLNNRDGILSEEERLQLEDSLRIHKELYFRLGQ